eukprot:TRINITY_DN7100_c0_g3_i8.p1 TRINITY_DN7100_c0_g3~~TRINITY_DN7100_c0_g3_i8.p1  ORF type:complete len:328 (-),score=55.94 TRINITY_DN7100_c0_g3_i8:132-1115(-)
MCIRDSREIYWSVRIQINFTENIMKSTMLSELAVQELLTDSRTLIKIHSILRSNGIDPIYPCLRLDIENVDPCLDLQFDASDLQALFSYFGDIAKIQIHPQKKSSANITFVSIVSAYFAQQALHEYHLPQYSAALSLRWVEADSSPARDYSCKPTAKHFKHNPEQSYLQYKKFTCRFEIQIENDSRYQISRRLIGPKGANMKRILRECSRGSRLPIASIIKLRLRGRGSGFLEGPKHEECKEPLHLCISSCFYEKYLIAKKRVTELLIKLYADYKRYCIKLGKPAPNLKIKAREDVKVRQSKAGRFSENWNSFQDRTESDHSISTYY